jgi:hypothetical protein
VRVVLPEKRDGGEQVPPPGFLRGKRRNIAVEFALSHPGEHGKPRITYKKDDRHGGRLKIGDGVADLECHFFYDDAGCRQARGAMVHAVDEGISD